MREGEPIPVKQLTMEKTPVAGPVEAHRAAPIHPAQEGKLRAYAHVLEQAHIAQDELDRGEPHQLAWAEPGKEPQVIFKKDERFVQRMKQIAFDIYDAELADDPVTRQAAQDILTQQQDQRKAQEDARDASLRRLLGDAGTRT